MSAAAESGACAEQQQRRDDGDGSRAREHDEGAWSDPAYSKGRTTNDSLNQPESQLQRSARRWLSTSVGSLRCSAGVWSIRPDVLLKVLRVHRDEVLPLVGRLVEGEDRFDGTRGHAGAAIDALVGMDEELSTVANSGSSLRGWMQSTGQTSTQAVSFVPMHGSVMM